MILLFTDFGQGIYTAQMEIVLRNQLDDPRIPIINLCSDAPHFNPIAAGHLLAALSSQAKQNDVFVAVVDPGVGTTARKPIVVCADGVWFVGPDNGLFDVVIGRARTYECFDVTWQPPNLSVSFHGRDLFAPIAAKIANRDVISSLCKQSFNFVSTHNCGDLKTVIYIDGYGNVFTGMRAGSVSDSQIIRVNGVKIYRAKTFGDVPKGQPFWYVNSLNLIEIAVNKGSASTQLGLAIGDVLETD